MACGDDGITSFDLLRHRRRDDAVFLYVFDLIELTGDDRRRDPLEQRKLDLTRLLAKAGPGLRLNEWIDGGEHDGATIFLHACKLGLDLEAEGWSLVGFGQRRRLETAELALRAALAERDEYLRQLNDALAACEELRRQRNYFCSELELRAQLASDLTRRLPSS